MDEKPPISPSPGRLGQRRRTRVVSVGDLMIGGVHPIVIQSMTISDTMDTDAVVSEIREIVEAGCPLVRLTAPSVRDAENLREIRKRLHRDGFRVPLVADIHFTPNAAIIAAEIVEKVRINPGNYADRKMFQVREYSNREYQDELERVAERFRPLVRRLKETGAALRIGVNHGSLSDRIVNRYGDTPTGMVESAMEFIRICESENYRQIVVSMKSSIPSVTATAYRCLARRMDACGMDYPFHLGVTEAGDGLEGRIKSAVGIGALLLDGIGDTIRVSLAEDSKHEIPAARALLEAVERQRWTGTAMSPAHEGPAPMLRQTSPTPIREEAVPEISAGSPRRPSAPWILGDLALGGGAPIRVEQALDLANGGADAADDSELLSVRPARTHRTSAAALSQALADLRSRKKRPILLEWRFREQGEIHLLETLLPYVDGLSLDMLSPESGAAPPADPLAGSASERVRLVARLASRRSMPVRWRLPQALAQAAENPQCGMDRMGALARSLSDLCREEGLRSVGFICDPGPGLVGRVRTLASALEDRPDLVFLEVPARGADAPMLAGSPLMEGIGDALSLIGPDLAETADTPFWPPGGRRWMEEPVSSAFAILQACRVRLTRAEFIACPSCGRTQFDLQSTTQKIRSLTEHLTGVKIAVMGCVVNGPGEMADADFGYVGSGPGRVDLYVGRERVTQGIPEAEAPARLCDLIRNKGKWADS